MNAEQFATQKKKIKSNLTLENECWASAHMITEEHSATPSSCCSSQSSLSAVAAQVLGVGSLGLTISEKGRIIEYFGLELLKIV